jgi:hypothetical protein
MRFLAQGFVVCHILQSIASLPGSQLPESLFPVAQAFLQVSVDEANAADHS